MGLFAACLQLFAAVSDDLSPSSAWEQLQWGEMVRCEVEHPKFPALLEVPSPTMATEVGWWPVRQSLQAIELEAANCYYIYFFSHLILQLSESLMWFRMEMKMPQKSISLQDVCKDI